MNTDEKEELDQLSAKVIGAAQRVSNRLGCGFLEYYADLIVEDKVIVELKAVSSIGPIHQAQCLNYLKAKGLPLCLLVNFARPRLEVTRFIGRPS